LNISRMWYSRGVWRWGGKYPLALQ
jgi:hypothetical protein